MYEALVTDLRGLAKIYSLLGKEDMQKFRFAVRAADAIEELDMKLHGANAAIAGMQREIERMVIDSANSKPQWIPVTERLPEEDVPVLVYLFGDSPYIAWINHENEWETEEFTIDRDYLPQAWMPLPEPPKEET